MMKSSAKTVLMMDNKQKKRKKGNDKSKWEMHIWRQGHMQNNVMYYVQETGLQMFLSYGAWVSFIL